MKIIMLKWILNVLNLKLLIFKIKKYIQINIISQKTKQFNLYSINILKLAKNTIQYSKFVISNSTHSKSVLT